MSRDWFSPIEGLCSNLRRKLESARAAFGPADIQHQQEFIHDREELLEELRAIQTRRLAGLAAVLVTEENGHKRALNSEEVRELQNPLIAIHVLRSSELSNGQPLFLDRTSLPTHIDDHSTESLTITGYADDLQALSTRMETLQVELRHLRDDFQSEMR